MKIAIVFVAVTLLSSAAFEIKSVTQQVSESNPVTRLIFKSGISRFSCVPPGGWSRGMDAQTRRIWFESLQAPRGVISIQLFTNAAPADVVDLRQRATNGLHLPKIVEEFRAPGGRITGHGFDIVHESAAGTRIMKRSCIYSVTNGTLQVSLSTSPDEWDDLQSAWTVFITSFRAVELTD